MHLCESHALCVEQALANAERICSQKEVRLTTIRRKVLELIWASHSPAKAYAILGQIGSIKAQAKPPTVYRALNFLTENGLVHKLNSLNSYVGCSHPRKNHECYFLICKQCGEVKECCNKEIDDVISGTIQKNKFISSQVTLEIEGKCINCVGVKE